MRILTRTYEATTLQDCFSVFILPRILLALFLMTLGYKQVLGIRHKNPMLSLPTFRDTTPLHYTFTEGDIAKLYCSIQNLGAKTVVWRKTTDENPLTIGDMIYTPDNRFQIAHVPEKEEWNLMIKDVKHGDAGIYECQVSTKEKYIRKLLRVTVEERPYADRAIVIMGPQTVKRGDSLVLSCNATSGKSTPQDLTWEKDQHKLTADKSGRINITKHISYVTHTIISNLTINYVVDLDEGTYICKTSDEMVKNVTIEVKENVKRTVPQSNKNPLPTSSAASFTSSSSSSPLTLHMFVTIVYCSLTLKHMLDMFVLFCQWSTILVQTVSRYRKRIPSPWNIQTELQT